jgi:hypothetical protein
MDWYQDYSSPGTILWQLSVPNSWLCRWSKIQRLGVAAQCSSSYWKSCCVSPKHATIAVYWAFLRKWLVPLCDTKNVLSRMRPNKLVRYNMIVNLERWNFGRQVVVSLFNQLDTDPVHYEQNLCPDWIESVARKDTLGTQENLKY